MRSNRNMSKKEKNEKLKVKKQTVKDLSPHDSNVKGGVGTGMGDIMKNIGQAVQTVTKTG